MNATVSALALVSALPTVTPDTLVAFAAGQTEAAPVGSALSPAPVTATEGEAAAIVSREATDAEKAETDAALAEIAAAEAAELAELDKAATLSDFVASQAGQALAVSDTKRRASTVGLALAMLIRNGNRTVTGEAADPGLDAFVKNQALADAARRGVMVFRNEGDTRDSERAVAALAEMRGAEKVKAARDYIMVFGKGRKLTEGAALLTRDASRLASLFRDNVALHGYISAALTHKDNAKAAYPAFKDAVAFVTATTGAEALSGFLAETYGRADAGKGKGKGKAAAKGAKAADTATAPALPEGVTSEPKAELPTLVLQAPAPEPKTVTVFRMPEPSSMSEGDKVSAIFDMVDTMDDDAFASLFQRMQDEAARRRDVREAAALDAMRADADAAATEAAAKAADVLAVEIALAPAKAKRATIKAKAA